MEKGGWLLIETILLVSAAGARWMHCGAVARQVVSEARRLFWTGGDESTGLICCLASAVQTVTHRPSRRRSAQCTAQEANAGCLQCDRMGKKCTLCDEGYYQMPNGTCKKVRGPDLHHFSFCGPPYKCRPMLPPLLRSMPQPAPWLKADLPTGMR